MSKGINLKESTGETRKILIENGEINKLTEEIFNLLNYLIISNTKKARTATCDSIYKAIAGEKGYGKTVDNVVKRIINKDFIEKRNRMDDNQWIQYCEDISKNLGINNTNENNRRSIRLSTLTNEKLNDLIENDDIPGAQEIANNLENYTLTEYLVMTLTVLGVFHNIPEDKIKKILKEQKINRKVDIENLCKLSSNVNNSRGKHGYRDSQEKVAECFGIDI